MHALIQMGDREFGPPEKSHHHRPASETPLKWRFAARAMMACLEYGYGLPLPSVKYTHVK